MNLRRLIQILWASPCSAVGLALSGAILLLGGRVRGYAGTLEVTLPEKLGCGASIPLRAIVFGHVVLAVSARELPRLRAHEHAHVRQYERWGILFFPAYALNGAWQWLKGRRAYWDNAFEVEAREQAALSNPLSLYSDHPTVRAATLADCAALAALAGELGYPAAEAEMRQRMSRLANRTEHAVFVAEADVVMGWIHVGVVESLESGQFAEIFGLVVGEKHRGRKGGAALVRAAEQWALGQGCRELRVRSNVTRTRARRFYEAHDYRITKTQNVFVKPLE